MFKLVTRQTRCLLASLRPLCATSASQYGTHKTATGPILDLNVVQPVYPDFIPHNTTVVQRFFETASLWPNKVAMVSSLGSEPSCSRNDLHVGHSADVAPQLGFTGDTHTHTKKNVLLSVARNVG